MIASRSEVYRSNIGSLYDYGGVFFKLIHSKHPIRMAGWEEIGANRKKTAKGEAGNLQKLGRNISRARQSVFELVLCNQWDYFLTLTFASEKVSDRYDLAAIMKKFQKWLSNYGRRVASGELSYLLIPEKHEDGAWHLHGFIKGIPPRELRRFTRGEHLPYSVLNELKKGRAVFCWTAFSKKFGYCTLEPLRSQDAAARYVVKYITKDLKRSVEALGAHLYYCSKGLERRELLFRDEVMQPYTPDFENEHVSIKQTDNAEELLQLFCDE